MKEKTMIAYCDELVKLGRELAVTWEGGSDSGWFDFTIDGKPIDSPDPSQEKIIKCVADVMGYGSFDGDFTARGEVVYNPKTKCFEGQDEYSEDEHDSCDCKLPVEIPSTIWFDKMLIHLESEHSFGGSVTINLQLNNGPLSTAHETWQDAYAKILESRFNHEIHQLEEFNGVWDNIELDFMDFKKRGKVRVYEITSFDYTKWQTESKRIIVPLL
ncbi:hypothetical protein ABIE26_002999 [Pedobacter africanus]|uniref:hypothetical protein n=1 Tax=Pedobacter africanus TaxID=151894 RepID=UPI003399B5C9